MLVFGPTPLRNSIAMATPKVTGDQKLFQRVCYTLILKVTKFQLPTPDSFCSVLKNQLGANVPPPPSKIGLKGFLQNHAGLFKYYIRGDVLHRWRF